MVVGEHKVYAVGNKVDEALHFADGNSFVCRYADERISHDSRVNRIVDGANSIWRLFVALTAVGEVGKAHKELAGDRTGIFDNPIKGVGFMCVHAWRRAS